MSSSQNPRKWPGLVWSLVLCLRFYWWSLVQVEVGKHVFVCIFTLELSWGPGSKQNPLRVPQWALCLDSQLVPWELQWTFAFISQHFLLCVPYFCSTQEAEEWLLMAKILWAERKHWGPHSKGEEEGALSQVDGDLQSRPAVCALLVPEGIALALRCQWYPQWWPWAMNDCDTF